MVLSPEDKILIKALHEVKGYGARRIVSEFPAKQWTVSSVTRLIRKLRETGTVDRRNGSGRPRTARTAENIASVSDLVLSQEDAPQTHSSIRQISRLTGIHRSSVVRIVHKELSLKCIKKRRAHDLTAANRATRLSCAKSLLRKFPMEMVDFMFFSDEKIFTVAPPINTQNDRLYVPVGTTKRRVSANRLLRTRATFSSSVMVSVAVSKLGCTQLVFVEPGAKINGAYYRDVLLTQHLLPAIREIAGDMWIFQQDNAPAHRARDTVELLSRATPEFISLAMWPANSPDLNPIDYRIWGLVQERVYQIKIRNVEHLCERLTEVWSGLSQGVINEAVDQWRDRLRACIRAGGGHFEHIL